jgi:hypothetical protein
MDEVTRSRVVEYLDDAAVSGEKALAQLKYYPDDDLKEHLSYAILLLNGVADRLEEHADPS